MRKNWFLSRSSQSGRLWELRTESGVDAREYVKDRVGIRNRAIEKVSTLQMTEEALKRMSNKTSLLPFCLLFTLTCTRGIWQDTKKQNGLCYMSVLVRNREKQMCEVSKMRSGEGEWKCRNPRHKCSQRAKPGPYTPHTSSDVESGQALQTITWNEDPGRMEDLINTSSIRIVFENKTDFNNLVTCNTSWLSLQMCTGNLVVIRTSTERWSGEFSVTQILTCLKFVNHILLDWNVICFVFRRTLTSFHQSMLG